MSPIPKSLSNLQIDAQDKQEASLLSRIYAHMRKPIYWTVLCLAGGALTVNHGKAVIALFVEVSIPAMSLSQEVTLLATTLSQEDLFLDT